MGFIPPNGLRQHIKMWSLAASGSLDSIWIFSRFIPVTEVLDWGILLQERMCEVYPFLPGLAQVNWGLITFMSFQIVQNFMTLRSIMQYGLLSEYPPWNRLQRLETTFWLSALPSRNTDHVDSLILSCFLFLADVFQSAKCARTWSGIIYIILSSVVSSQHAHMQAEFDLACISGMSGIFIWWNHS